MHTVKGKLRSTKGECESTAEALSCAKFIYVDTDDLDKKECMARLMDDLPVLLSSVKDALPPKKQPQP